MTDQAAPERRVPELELAFPPRPEYVSTARHTVAALARLHELSDDVVEDIKLAVSEACTSAVVASSREESPHPVRVAALVDGSTMVIEVEEAGEIGAGPGEGDGDAEIETDEGPFQPALSMPVLQGLVEQVEIVRKQDGRSAVRLRVGMPSAEAPAE
jgi:anti-sigma regulatory factor (Ser/Thr protein kinase)